ncbi:MAG TPA: DUF1697 domain-containing protein [Gemmatimonadales bacterium]|jgi:uncharacterized protein (DUF1697 family)
MASVVFLRGVNVGGARVFRPKALSDSLEHFGCVNVGAAGTFVIGATLSEAKLKAEITKRLPFETHTMICRAETIIEIVDRDPFARGKADKKLRRFGSVMNGKPKTIPRLPVAEPADAWLTKLIGVEGRLAWGWWRTLDGVHFRDPNMLIEQRLGVKATTRNWNTFEKIREILRKG